MAEPLTDVVAPDHHFVSSIASDRLNIAGLIIAAMEAPEVKHNEALAAEMTLMALRWMLAALRQMYWGDIEALRNCASAALGSTDCDLRFIGRALADASDEPGLLGLAGSLCEVFYNYRLKAQAADAAKDFGVNGADMVSNALYEVAAAVDNNKTRR